MDGLDGTQATGSEEARIPGCSVMLGSRYVPLLRNGRIRKTVGFILLGLSATLAGTVFGQGRIVAVVLITAIAWVLTVFLTEKYVHKYPQRYYSYLVASHLKAAIVMAICLWVMGIAAGSTAPANYVLWTAYGLFIASDALVSIPRRRDFAERQQSVPHSTLVAANIGEEGPTDDDSTKKEAYRVGQAAVLNQVRASRDQSMTEFVEKNLPILKAGSGHAVVLNEIADEGRHCESGPVQLLITSTRMNDVRRLNRFLMVCAKSIERGGFFVGRYMPLEDVLKRYRRRYTGLTYLMVYFLHFTWYRAIPKMPLLDRIYFSPLLSWLDSVYLKIVKKRNRALPKAELWGRLAFWGMRVVAESEEEGERYILAEKVSLPVQNRIPSYYFIASLEKIGLDGQIIRTHKIRTMYPFSEFIQERIYEDHGLSATGKFADDFRLADYGRFLRKYWLDELPQIFDWLRGDIKLVGVRATSPHFLSLYPKDVYDLYVQVKPGLIPPIFGESTKGLSHIIEVELAYLKKYLSHPIRTDVRYFWRTFGDIVFRGVRSK